MGRRIAVAFAIVAMLVLAGYGFYRLLLVEGAGLPPSSDAGTGVEGLRRVKVVSIGGRVEKRRGDAPWTVVKTGDELLQEEAIRTSDDGKALLDVGDIATVEVSARSEFTVRELSETASRVRLEEGRLAADVHGVSQSTFKVEAKGSDAVAETSQGQFSVLTTGRGQVSVATRKGRVRLSAKNRTVEVTAGKQSVVLPEQPPGLPEDIPPSVFLKVARPKSRVQREKETVIKGTTTPGAVVSINGVYARANQEGQFEATVALNEGRNKILVEAEDAAGHREKAELPEITVDTRPPNVKTDVKWGED